MGTVKVSKANEAVDCFNSGFNCAQAVLTTYCEQFGLDRETALRLSCGLGGGMGRNQETCGAVTGAYLVIGLKCGQCREQDRAAKETTYALVREFSQRFEARNKTTNCRELLGVDLLHRDKALASQQVRQVCPAAVRDATEILESILDL